MKIIVVLSIVVLVGCRTSDQTEVDPQITLTQTSPSIRAAEPAKLGESRRDEGHPYYREIAFTVLGFSESAELPSNSEFCPPAISASRGKWIAVRVKAVNEGTEPVVLATNANQVLYDGDRRYESETSSGCQPAGLLSIKLQPDDEAIGVYVWDVRPEVSPGQVELIVTDRHGIDRRTPGALFSLR
jgi:hypothetical protein